MNVGSLFSGIGGLDHGLHRAGLSHLFFCEQDKWRRSVLAQHWPEVPIYDDVRIVAGDHEGDGQRRWGTRAQQQGRHHPGCDGGVDLLCGGFPCQDLSVAGRRRGLAGERSGLFYEFARIIDAVRPGWVLIENVPGLLSSNGGRDFGIVLGTLADLGYGVAWRVLDSRFFGVPQRRRRVFIVGAVAVGDPRAAAERAGEVLAVGSRCSRHPATRGQAGPESAVASLSGLGSGGPDDNDGQGGRLVIGPLQNAGRDPRGVPSTDEVAGGQLVAVHHDNAHDSIRAGHLDLVGDGERVPLDLVVEGVVGVAQGERLDFNPVSANHEMHESSFGTVTDGILQETEAGCKRWNGDTSSRPPASVAFSENQRAEVLETPIARQLTSGGGKPGQGYPAVRTGASVRRLTPTECERLQALPDGWTAYGPDSRRYAALGDAVTSSVGEWIGRRLMAVAA